MTTSYTRYVAGFMFDQEMQYVALIRKQKPEWQRGFLNGIGGHIEKTDSDALAAMVREFEEETGLHTSRHQWSQYAEMNGTDWTVIFFAALGDLNSVRTTSEETVEIVDISAVYTKTRTMIENLPWLIALAIDNLADGRPKYATIEYP